MDSTVLQVEVSSLVIKDYLPIIRQSGSSALGRARIRKIGNQKL
jgi:hypothetical protein